MRAMTEGRTVEGYAAIFDQETDLGYFREIIVSGAFDGCDMSDVRALFNHDPNQILARTASGTMSVSVDEKGLKYRFEMPNTTLGNDLLEMIRRGDVSQSSFAFTVKETSWVEEKYPTPDLRKIIKIERVYDVSPVTYPAYEGTSVQARSIEQVANEERTKIKIEIEVDTDPQPEPPDPMDPAAPETDGMKKPKMRAGGPDTIDDQETELEKEHRQMDERVREAQFSLIQTSLTQ